MAETDPEALYDGQAERWRRREPSSLSDFTGRPAIFEMLGDLTGARVVDLGCGEGYCTRECARRGAAEVLGVEISAEMVDRAREAEAELKQGIVYRQGDVRALDLETGAFDLATAVFVFNYLTLDETRTALREIHRVLAPGGRLVFSIPHPSFPFIQRERGKQPPFWFDFGDKGYFSARDARAPGRIHRRDGQALEVQMVHKTLEDLFGALRDAGFTALPRLKEMSVLPEHLELDRPFFAPVADLPLHMGVEIER
jgi:SAM-dependent methyltransferase